MNGTVYDRTDDPQWVLCGSCKIPIYRRKWTRDLHVCAECGDHARLRAHTRLEALFDTGSAHPVEQYPRTADILGFVDRKPYSSRLAEARAHTGMDEAVLCVRGTIGGNPVVAAVMDFAFLGGSLGGAVGELITTAAEIALAERTPLLLVSASGGARMQEGAFSLMQMAKTSAVMARLDEAGVLSICLLTDPTYGGVAASFASLADVIIAEPGVRMGFAGRRVIEQTIRQQLPPSFQTADFLLERGFVDMIVPRSRQRGELAKLLRVGSAVRDAEPHPLPYTPPRDELIRDSTLLAENDPWELVLLARALDRPTVLEYMSAVFTGFQELHGDRVSEDCSAVVVGTAWLGDQPVAVVGTQKGHDPSELQRRNFGMATPAGYRKAQRMMQLAAKLGMPVITLVDTPGAYPGAQAEEQGQAVVIAETIRCMTSLPVPVVTVLTGEGGSGGALALATANRVLSLANSIYSVISPEGCAAILWQNPAAASKAAEALGLTPRSLLSHGIIDGVVPEPPGGAGADPLLTADRLTAALTTVLQELATKSGDELAQDRRRRFRQFGAQSVIRGEEVA